VAADRHGPDQAVERLLAAYDDAAGITAQFNLNLLHRINAELGGTIDVPAWRHRAIWNDPRARIEMHLEAVRDNSFSVAGRSFSFVPARRSTPRTATNMASVKPGCCCSPPAGAWCASGLMPKISSRFCSRRPRPRVSPPSAAQPATS
jgi:hypothetical protein